jgi:hypothetical protein
VQRTRVCALHPDPGVCPSHDSSKSRACTTPWAVLGNGVQLFSKRIALRVLPCCELLHQRRGSNIPVSEFGIQRKALEGEPGVVAEFKYCSCSCRNGSRGSPCSPVHPMASPGSLARRAPPTPAHNTPMPYQRMRMHAPPS